jgi:hypothetical protein
MGIQIIVDEKQRHWFRAVIVCDQCKLQIVDYQDGIVRYNTEGRPIPSDAPVFYHKVRCEEARPCDGRALRIELRVFLASLKYSMKFSTDAEMRTRGELWSTRKS